MVIYQKNSLTKANVKGIYTLKKVKNASVQSVLNPL